MSTAGATAPKTPPHGVNSGSELGSGNLHQANLPGKFTLQIYLEIRFIFSQTRSELKSTPLAVGSASVSEHISAIGLNINDIRPWIGHDIENYRECPIDEMLQELLYRCTDCSKLVPDKPTLLADCLEAVLPICNKGKDAKVIKRNLDDIVKSKVEDQMYKPFIKASNLALDWLSKLNAPGLVCSKTHDNHKILFHQNDLKNITQKHQGKKSTHRPDVVIISCTGTKKVQKQSGQAYKDEEVWEMPAKQFQWTDIQLMVEFKHNKIWTGLSQPPVTYTAKAYNVPEVKKYMKYHREMNITAELKGSTMPLPGAAMSLHQTSDHVQLMVLADIWDAGECSKQARSLNKKKCGSSQALDGHSSKKLKVDNNGEEPPKLPKEPQDIHPVIQNGLYAAELFAAHVVWDSVANSLAQLSSDQFVS
ncbi:hypothetical protein BDR03DRAFT_981703 [Suillus americanus]|nr:hypothetical protein BDR03DRAFT_981703 [Suillus americanus]